MHAQMPQELVASKAGISPTFLADIERGRRMPSLEVTAKLAQVMGLPAERLMCHHPEQSVRELSTLAVTRPELVVLLARLGALVADGSVAFSEIEQLVGERKESRHG